MGTNAHPERIIHLPRPATDVFIGREELVAQLHEQRGAELSVCVISGLGGIGKSELALQYAESRRREATLIWWINSENADRAMEGIAELGHRVTPASDEMSSDEAVNLAINWLSRNSNWLLILDNLDEPSSVHSLLANVQGAGQLLLTTRRNLRWPGVCEVIQLEELSQDESVELVKRITGFRDADEEAPLRELAHFLGFLPLALDQASAYMRQTQVPPSRYLEKVSKNPVKVFDSMVDGDKQQSTILRIWNVTLATLVQRSEDAVEILHILAFCAPDDIPREAIGESDSDEDFDALLGLLASFSMVKLTSDAVHIHRLVRKVLLLSLLANPDVGQMARDICLNWLISHLPMQSDNELGSWPLLRRLIPHFEAIYAFYPEDERTSELGAAFNSLGIFETTQGNYPKALTFRKVATEVALSVLGEGHESSAIAMSNLGVAYRDLGQPDTAVELQRSALRMAEQCSAGDGVLAVIYGQLGRTLSEIGESIEALKHHQRAVSLAQNAWGSISVDTAIRLSDLGKAYGATGDLDECIPIFEQALDITKNVLPSGHPIVGIRMGDLAEAYSRAGKGSEAIGLVSAALDILRNSLGSGHPITNSCMRSASAIHHSTGHLEIALELIQESIELAPHEHPSVMRDRLANMATVLSDLGRHSEAIEAVKKALANKKALSRRNAKRLEMLLQMIEVRAGDDSI
ncbi:tetratricopeptide repeat protein [Streptomyces sp. ADI97-07]|uniref:tetratricopeptide repeat protein n=1 Tax=Streptomyces sp. ADI97-07 TaxID=1522762 RepID=UPI0013DDEFCC|nr:tetratricopeptide repeat protein [Streptomyces sp. ADI97-07]